MDGLWSSPDLAGLLRWAALNRDSLSLSTGWFRRPAQLRRTIAHRLRRNTKSQSRRNIAAHYDLGNDFYQTFLDETMTYSSAVFAAPDQSLADAQRNKYRRMADGAGLVRGQHVLEIGTGWGGFALYAAGELGCRVTTITISQEQHDLARERVRVAGLEHLVDVQLRDYRDIDGTYDAIVSIEMLEAVGAEYFETFFAVCDRRARPGGSAQPPVDHVPGRGLRAAAPRRELDPDVHLPGRPVPVAGRHRAVHARHALLVRSVTDIAADYVLTLRAWRTRFMDKLDDGSRPGLRRPVHPDVGVLPRPERGRVRHRDQPGPADRVREATRARGRRSRLIRGRCARLPSRDGSTARARHPDHRLDRHRRRDGGPVRGRGRLRLRRLALGRPRSCPRGTAGPCRGGGRVGRRRPGRCGRGRRRGPCRRPAVRAAGRRVRGGRRERPAVRRRADPRADARGLGSDASSSTSGARR